LNYRAASAQMIAIGSFMMDYVTGLEREVRLIPNYLDSNLLPKLNRVACLGEFSLMWKKY
jgi:hypothetical protein